MNDEDNNKGSRFTSAMGDLKGLLDKEGINLKSAEQLIKQSIDDSENTADEEIIPTLKTVDKDNSDQFEYPIQQADIPYNNDAISPINLPVLNGTITVVDENETDPVPIGESLSDFDSLTLQGDRDTSPAKDFLLADGSLPADGSSPADGSNSVDLDNYISDFDDDDDQFDMDGFADSVKELEQKVASITEPEHLHKFEQSESKNIQMNQLKAQLKKQMTKQIETKINELKTSLLDSVKSEINELFDNLPKK